MAGTKSFRKFFVYISVFSIILQALAPFSYVQLSSKAYAQEATPTISSTPAPTDTVTPTPVPTDVPTPTVTHTPSDTPTPTPTPVPSDTPTPTPTSVDNLSPPPSNTPTSSDNSNNSSNSQVQGASVSPAPTVEPTASPSPTPTSTPETATGNEQVNLIILKNTSAPAIDLSATVSQGSAVLTTDKPDYAPTDTALITGSNLLPNTIYTLRVWSDDQPPTGVSAQVTSNDKGELAYAYQLDGTYRPNYKAELKDQAGNVVATTTFLDHDPKVTICHRSDSYTNPYGQETVDVSSVNGVGGSDHRNHTGPVWPSVGSDGKWGDIIPPTDNSGNPIPGGSMNWSTGEAIWNNDCDVPGTITIIKNVVGADGTFNFTSTGGHNLPSSFSITTSGNTGSQTYTNLSTGSNDYTITESLPTGYSLTGLSCDDSQASVNLSQRKITINNLDQGSNITCTFTNTQQQGSLKIVKNTTGGNATFNYTVTGPTPLSPSITTSGGTGYTGPTAVNAGTNYAITESVSSGWSFGSASCDKAYTTGTNGVTGVTVVAGQTTTCTFSNTKKATIIVKKTMVGGTDSFTFTGDVAGTISSNNGTLTTSNVLPGIYASVEGAATGWDLSGISCDDTNSTGNTETKTATFNVSAGETVTCTFTNAKRGSITIIKNTTGGNGTFNYTSNFGVSSLTTSGGTASQTVNNLIPGNGYSISEIIPTGWSLNSASCTNGTIDAITVVSGQTTTCTFTNALNKGTITVHKDVIGTSTDITKFCFTLNPDPGIGQVCANSDGNTVFENVPFGTYSVIETGFAPDYTQQSNNCTELSIANNGDSKNCTVENSRDQGTITIIKDLAPSNDPGKFNLQIGGSTVGIGANVGNGGTTGQISVDTGTYAVGETAGTDTVLSDYTSSISCDNDASGEGTSLRITVDKGNNIICTITNTRQTGELVVHKSVDRTGKGTFTPGDDSEFTWGFDSTTPENNTYLFGDPKALNTGSYSIYENSVPNYHSIGWFEGEGSCSDSELNGFPPAEVNVYDGETTDITVCNVRDTGTITVNKVVNPSEGDNGLFSLRINGTTYATGGNGTTTGTVTVVTGEGNSVGEVAGTETDLSNYVSQTSCISGRDNKESASIDPTDFNVSSGENITCTITNTRKGKIIVTKYNDINDDGELQKGEGVLSGWTINLGEDSKPTLGDGTATFDNLTPDNYLNLSEDLLNKSWEQTSINCDTENSYNDGGFFVSVNPGETVNCSILNHNYLPKLSISKSNNASGNKAPGDTVNFTITISNATDAGEADNVKVIDLLPKGFHYNSGSWHAVRNSTTLAVTEPTYASPGTWTLPNMAGGDAITLTYSATIDSSQQTGTYYDNAWGQGTAVSDPAVILAVAGTDGNIGDPNFVGTQVAVVSGNEPGVNYSTTSTQSVLGASTGPELPSTGENTLWVIIATLLSILGFGSLTLGIKIRRKYE